MNKFWCKIHKGYYSTRKATARGMCLKCAMERNREYRRKREEGKQVTG